MSAAKTHRDVRVDGVFPARRVDEFAGQLVDRGGDHLEPRVVPGKGWFQSSDLTFENPHASHLADRKRGPEPGSGVSSPDEARGTLVTGSNADQSRTFRFRAETKFVSEKSWCCKNGNEPSDRAAKVCWTIQLLRSHSASPSSTPAGFESSATGLFLPNYLWKLPNAWPKKVLAI